MTTHPLEAIHERLIAPFAASDLDLKPGALAKDGTRALALAYADDRCYQQRLDEVVGSWNWTVRFEIAPQGVVAHLTLFGVGKSDVGDYPTDADDANRVTSAAAQAFKRACARFGLGRYLYDLPKLWVDYDPAARQIVGPATAIADLYHRAGISDAIDTRLWEQVHAERRDAPPAPAAAPPPAKLATARTALAHAETATGLNGRGSGRTASAAPAAPAPSSSPATEKQLGFIAKLMIDLCEQDQGGDVDQVGIAHGIDALTSFRSRAKLAALSLSFETARLLIDDLKAISG